MWFDVPRQRIYTTGTETTTVLEQRDKDHYAQIADSPTGYRAKTSLLVPELNWLYVAVSGKGKRDAKLFVQMFDVHAGAARSSRAAAFLRKREQEAPPDFSDRVCVYFTAAW
jgi:hypothetical protein